MTSYSWHLIGNGLWTTAADWNPAGVPGASDAATIASNDVVTSNGNVTVGTLSLDHGADLSIDANTTFNTEGGVTDSSSGIGVNNGGTFEIGKDGITTSFDNGGFIDLYGGGTKTSLTIAGNVTLTDSTSGPGSIQLQQDLQPGSGAGGDEIVGDGIGSPTLTLAKFENIEFESDVGSGSISGLTLNLESQSAIFDSYGEFFITTGSHTVTNGGEIEVFQDGVLSIASPVNNSAGYIIVGGGDYGYEGGTILLSAAVASTSGTVGLYGYGTLELESGGSVAGVVQLHGTGNTLRLDTGTSQLSGFISGAVAGDEFDLAFQSFASGDHAVWLQTTGIGGTLSLVNSSSATLATLSLDGQYVSSDFSAVSDGKSGTLIEVVTPAPPTSTTADMIMYQRTFDYYAIANTDYEIYDIGSNTLSAANPLELVASDWQKSAPYFAFDANYQVVDLGGFNGSDTSDVLMRDFGSDTNSGAFGLFDLSNNNATGGALMGQVGLEWQVVGFGDFSSQPGETDMLMRDSNTGAFEVYDISNNAIVTAVSMGQVGAPWQVAGFGDFSGHAGETGDMLMRNGSTGQFEVYDIANNTITFAAGMGQVGLEWQVAGFGDFSGKANETDMLMRDSSNGQFEVYDISNNAIYNAASMGQVGLEWQVVGFGPINGAGTSDMLMRDTNNGAFEIYDIGNNQITNAASMGQVGPEWSVAGIAADPPSGAAAASTQVAQALAGYAPSDAAAGIPAATDQATPQSLVPNFATAANSQSALPG